MVSRPGAVHAHREKVWGVPVEIANTATTARAPTSAVSATPFRASMLARALPLAAACRPEFDTTQHRQTRTAHRISTRPRDHTLRPMRHGGG